MMENIENELEQSMKVDANRWANNEDSKSDKEASFQVSSIKKPNIELNFGATLWSWALKKVFVQQSKY